MFRGDLGGSAQIVAGRITTYKLASSKPMHRTVVRYGWILKADS